MRVRALVIAVACGVAVWGLWRTFVASWPGQQVERIALDGAVRWPVGEHVLDVVSVGFIAGAIVLAVVLAALRRRWAIAGQAVLLVAGANLTTRILKQGVLDRPRLGDDPPYANTLPSGHTTAAASVCAALLLVAPARARPAVVVVGVFWTALTGGSTLAGQWHRPSDVVAALMVVLGWAALAGALHPQEEPGPAPRGTRTVVWALVTVGVTTGAAAAGALGIVWSVRDDPTSAAELIGHVGGMCAAVAAVAFGFVAMFLLRRGLDDGS